MSSQNLFYYELHKLFLNLVRLQWSLAFCYGEVRSVDRNIIRGMDRRYLHISYLDYLDPKRRKICRRNLNLLRLSGELSSSGFVPAH